MSSKKEYRVVWQRDGFSVKRKRYATLKAAARFAAFITDPEPWKLSGKDGSEYFCCSGRDCGCEGLTVAEECAQRREGLPLVTWLNVEEREVGPWLGIASDVNVEYEEREATPLCTMCGRPGCTGYCSAGMQ